MTHNFGKLLESSRDRFEKKGHRAFLKLRLVVLAKLSKGRIDFASNHGTMPRQAAEPSHLKPTVRKSWVIESPTKFANHRRKITNRCKRIGKLGFFINRIKPAKTHPIGVTSLTLPIA